MGQVYRAKDHKLGRDVAIKVLREELASDPARLRRFEQEARSASALNHPNIITIYDIRLRQGYGGQVGKIQDIDFIVMEFVDGKTLREMLAEGPLPTKKLLQLAAQIAEGLAKAHSAGIVHRDLKPENLMVTSDGYVKILDFGLAKLMPEVSGFASEMNTITKAGTRDGIILGTVQYMSPEQAAGRSVDYRSDQFTLGSILYEMATGKLAFQKDNIPQTLSDIIENAPEPISTVNPKLPSHLPAVIERCLSKEPQERYDSTRDLARELRSIESTPLTIREDAKPIRSLVVLPLTNLSAEPEQEYFSDGMTEALITDLAKIGALKVISRTSAMRYKKTDKSIPEIGRELNVDAVVEGSVLRAGDRVRITAQLIKAETDEHLWAESYERDLRDILALQSEVARAVALEVRIKLTPQEEARLQEVRTVDPEVHEAYLKGRFYWSKLTGEGLEKGLEYFKKAIEKDPNYAPAHAGLADIYNLLSLFTASAPKEVYPKAKAAAMRALELDETLPEAHTALGWVKMQFDWDWSGAEKEYKRAVELNPGSSYAHSWYGAFLTFVGRHTEAIAEAKRGEELDPLSIQVRWILGWVLTYARRYDEAMSKIQEVIMMDPDFWFGHMTLGFIHWARGQFEQATASCRKAVSGFGESDPRAKAFLGAICAVAGHNEEASEILRECVKLSKERYVSPWSISLIHVGLGNKDQAFEWLEKAYEKRDGDMTLIKVFAWFDPLRSDPRFKDLLRRMSFPE
jgi:serine/threonine-protein kinase